MSKTDWLWGFGLTVFAATVGYAVYWIIDRGDPHQRRWKKDP